MDLDQENAGGERSTEETDQLNRSIKKYKRHANGKFVPPTEEENRPNNTWSQRLFTEVLRGPPIQREFYVSDGEESDINSDMDDFNNLDSEAEESRPGRVAVVVSKAECRALWRPWRRALIVKLLGRNISFRLLEQRLRSLWGLSEGCVITDLEEGYYIVRFYTKADYQYVLEGGPWIIQGHYLNVMKWRPYFRSDNNAITTTLAWVRIPRLPIEFYNEKVLLQIGDKFGKAEKVDITMLRVERGKYARVCVEVDLTKPLTSVVNLNGREYKVEYEGLHLICFKCGRYGHRNEECGGSMNVSVAVDPPPTQASKEKELDDFGPWMVATNNRRRRPPMREDTNADKQSHKEYTSAVRQPMAQSQFGEQGRGSGPRQFGNTEGSRFGVLGGEDDNNVETYSGTISMEDLRNRLQRMPDMAEKATFSAICKDHGEPSKARPRKGVHLKNVAKVKTQPVTPYVPRVEQRPKPTRSAGIWATQEGRPHLKDLTNMVVTQKPCQPSNKYMEVVVRPQHTEGLKDDHAIQADFHMDPVRPSGNVNISLSTMDAGEELETNPHDELQQNCDADMAMDGRGDCISHHSL